MPRRRRGQPESPGSLPLRAALLRRARGRTGPDRHPAAPLLERYCFRYHGPEYFGRWGDADAGSAGTDGAGAGGTDAHGDASAETRRTVRRAAASCPGPYAERRQAALAEDGGIRVAQETARRIACDAATVTMRHGPDGGVLDGGRRTRTISPALRRALAARDG